MRQRRKDVELQPEKHAVVEGEGVGGKRGGVGNLCALSGTCITDGTGIGGTRKT